MTPAETQTATEALPPLWFFIFLFTCLPFTAVAAWRFLRWMLSSSPVPLPIESDVPAVPWPVWVGMVLFAGLQICMILVVAAYSLVVQSGLVPAEPPGGIAMFSPAIFLAQTVPPLIFLAVVRMGDRNGLASVGVRSGRFLTGIGYGVFAFLAVLPVCFLALLVNEHLNSLLHIPVQEHPLEEAVRLHRETWVVLLAIVQAGILAALSEEFAFRGILMTSLLRPFGAVSAMVLTSLVFALVHLPSEPQAILPLAVLGLALAYVAYRTRSLVAPVITHFLFNTFMLLTIFTAPV